MTIARGGCAARHARAPPGREQGAPQEQPGRAGEHDGSELESAVRDDEGEEIRAVAARGQVAADGAEEQPR